MLTTDDVPLAESALLVVDAQDSFTLGARWARRSNPAFAEHVAALVEAYREAGRPVIFFLHTDGDEGFATDHPLFRLMDFLRPQAGEPVLVKDTRNCFTSTRLHAMLRARGVRRVAIAGIQMEQCCETTARVAADLGYAVDFVIDATMTFPIPHPTIPGRELGTAEIEERTTYVLARRFARVVTTAELAAEVGEAVVVGGWLTANG